MAKFSVSGSNTTVSFNYTAATDRVQAVINAAAEYLWDHGYGDHGSITEPILFSSLTNAQKLALVDDCVLHFILVYANAKKLQKAQEATFKAEEATNLSF